jgi:hypothetical protein
MPMKSKEQARLEEKSAGPVPPWQKWGPYVSERAWGTVREDYSANGDAWSYFPYDLAYSKAYRWGEDAIAGWCDRYQILVFAPVFWNGKDPWLKERLFGLSSWEGNHGEDVKEYYYHLDGTPTHSYMKYLYKYPQGEFPYQKLREENQKRSSRSAEYELIDTGIFNENRYFDIFIEYAKASPEDLCIRIEICNRSKESAPIHVLPHLWFRNQWAWGEKRLPEPKITAGKNGLIADEAEMSSPSNLSFEYRLGKRYLYGPKGMRPLFTKNETNLKDAFHRALIRGEKEAAADPAGSKACLHEVYTIGPEENLVLTFRLTDKEMEEPLKDVEKIIASRKEEADAFYAEIQSPGASAEEKMIQRQAFAGMIWNKQIYLYDVAQWLKGDNDSCPPPPFRYHIRNMHWGHLNSMRVLAMPDKWEYPYFCAWDQAFQCITMALFDIECAKEQLWLLLFDQFQHPNGEIPACEWEFSDLNPPVQGWVVLRLFEMEKQRFGREDREFLERCFHKLLMNFSWWVNKVDSAGNNVFEGGFLGMDNITVLDRSHKLPGGAKLQQSDGTGWMAMFCLNLMRIALILASKDRVYESLATKFFEHYVYIAHAMKIRGNKNYEMWSDKDGFFYDVLTYPDGAFSKFRVRSLVGIIPLYAVEILEEENLKLFPEFHKNFLWFLNNRKDLVESCIIPAPHEYVLTLMNKEQLESVLEYVWDPQEFRSDFGLRSLSKFHEEYPFIFEGKEVRYESAESFYKVKGGNSNWRGPVWVQTNFLLIDSLKKFAHAFKQEIQIEVEGEKPVDLEKMARSFADRVISIFTADKTGARPYLGQFPFRTDPHWRDYLLFYEHFNPETGQGLGASHQAGWSALVANLINEFRVPPADGKRAPLG